MAKGIQSAEDIREDLECPVCQVIPKSVPIYQCKAGHIHCKECHPRLQNCPVCRGDIGEIRALVLENIIAKLPTKCSFTEYGCLEEEKLPKDMILHEKDCFYRVVKCLYSRCIEEISLSGFMEHFREKHDCSMVQDAKDFKVSFRVRKDHLENDSIRRLGYHAKPWFVKSSEPNQTFVVHLRGDDRGHVCFYFFIVGSQSDIDKEKYKCKINIKNHRSLPVSQFYMNGFVMHLFTCIFF